MPLQGFGRPHDAVFAVAGMKGGDADHQGGGEVPATGWSDRDGGKLIFK